MSRRLIIDGNSIYELDEECMVRGKRKMQEGEQSEIKNKKMDEKVLGTNHPESRQ